MLWVRRSTFGAAEKRADAARVDREVGAVAARALNHPASVDRRADQLDRVGLDRRLHHQHVAPQRVRHVARVQIRRGDLDVDRRLQLVDQRRLAEQRFDLRTDLPPFGVRRT